MSLDDRNRQEVPITYSFEEVAIVIIISSGNWYIEMKRMLKCY